MKQNNYKTTPLVDLMTEITFKEQEIGTKMIYINNCIEEINKEITNYELMRAEIMERFPQLEKEECFKQKKLVRKVDDYGFKKRR